MDIEKIIKNTRKYDKGSDNFVGAVYDYARSHREKFAKQFNGSFIKRYEIGYDALIEAMNQINFEKKDHWPLHRGTQWIMIKNNLVTLFSSFQLLTSGFYNDSINLVRSLFESLIRIFFISYYPDKREQVLFNAPKGERFKLLNFLKDDLQLNRMGQYKVLSIKSHSNSYQTLKDVVDLQQNGQKKVINIELAWNVDDLSLALNHIDFIMRNYIYFVKEFLVKENKEWYEKLTDIEQGFYASFYSLSQSHPKNIFYKMCNEAIQKYQDILLRENQ